MSALGEIWNDDSAACLAKLCSPYKYCVTNGSKRLESDVCFGTASSCHYTLIRGKLISILISSLIFKVLFMLLDYVLADFFRRVFLISGINKFRRPALY